MRHLTPETSQARRPDARRKPLCVIRLRTRKHVFGTLLQDPCQERVAQIEKHKSLFENYEWACGRGFWLWPRRRVPRIPKAGCKERANASHGQKTRRPKGFRAKGRLASLLLSRRPTRGILLRRASPSGLWLENRSTRSFQTGSKKKRLRLGTPAS